MRRLRLALELLALAAICAGAAAPWVGILAFYAWLGAQGFPPRWLPG